MNASPRLLLLPLCVLGLGVACGDDAGSGGSSSGGGTTTSSSTTSTTTTTATTTTTTATTTTGTTTGTTTSSTTSGMGGMGGMGGDGGMGGMGNAETVLYFGDFATDGVHEVATATYPGPTLDVLTLMGLAGADVTSVAYSPDGTQIAVAGRDTGADPMVINVYAADGSGSPLTLVTAAAADRQINQLAWSPDGAWIGFLYDGALAGGNALYVVPSDGSSAEKLVSQQPSAANRDITSFKWSPDMSGAERFIGFSGDLAANDDFGLWSVEITTATPTPVELVSDAELGAGEDVQGVLAFDDQNRLYFKSDFEVDNLFRLYRVDVDGMNRVQVPGTNLTNGSGEASIGSFGVSPLGDKIAFSSDSPSANLYEIYVMDLAGNTPSKVSNVAAMAPAGMTFSGPSFTVPIVWSPDGTHLGVIADYVLTNGENDNANAAYVFPTTGMGGVRVLGVPTSMGGNQDIDEVAFSADSTRLYARGDMRVEGDNELFSTTALTTADQDPTSILVQAVPASGDIDGVSVRP